MADYLETLAPLAADVLEHGERLRAALRGRARDGGDDGGRRAEVYVGRIGSILGPKIPQPRPPIDPRTGLPSLPPLLALGLTERRVIVFSRGPITGRVLDFVGSIPGERIHRLEAEPARMPLRRDRLTIHLTKGPSLIVDGLRRGEVERFATAFRDTA